MFGLPHDPAHERIVQYINLVFCQHKIVEVNIGANPSVKNPMANLLIAGSGLSKCLGGKNTYPKAEGESKSKIVRFFFHPGWLEHGVKIVDDIRRIIRNETIEL